MAAKRKTKAKSKSKKQPIQLKDGLVAEIFGVILIVLGLLLIVAMLGWAGQLPLSLFETIKVLIGVSAYIIPAVLILIAIKIFTSDNHAVSGIYLFGLSLIIISISGLAHTLHTHQSNQELVDLAARGDGGGYIGYAVNWSLANFLNNLTMIIFLVGVLVIGLMIATNTTIKTVINRISEWLEARRQRAEEKTEDFSFKTAINKHSQPTLNASVPLEKPTSRILEPTKKQTPADDGEALTVGADPEWNFPNVKLLNDIKEKADAGDWKGNAETIRQTLQDFKIPVEMSDINVGPRVTQYTLVPESGVRLTKITALEQNIALNLAATSIRIEAPIPGKRAVGIEVPNRKSASVGLRSIIESSEWNKSKSALTFALGQDISGMPVTAALEKMPHLLIAGATGSGKSVMINTFLASLLYRNSPSDLKLILVDPKQVELTPYNDIPHLLTPVIVEPEKTLSALKWSVAEMERRYSMLAEAGKRNIEDYNRLKDRDSMPYIVIVIDELADLMMLAARDVESLIVRLAQKARATGIHLTLATQRPSVDVITGLIKANIPARIAFTVTSQVDSRTILDQAGAEKLLGQGDMLYSSPSLPKPVRIQGAFVGEKELNMITDHIKMEREPDYNDDIVSQPVQIGGSNGGIVPSLDSGDDKMYKDAVMVVVEAGKASASMLQRRLRVGYARAARLIETMEEQGIVGPADGARPREVLVSSVDDLDGDD